jgi:proteic killer suppression protein
VIVSYRDRRTADFAAGKRVKALSGIERPARLKLDRVEAAHTLKDLAALPGENTWHASQFTQGNTWPKNLTP